MDGGYSGRLVAWVAERFKFCLTVVLRPKQTRQFVLLPRRWVVERKRELNPIYFFRPALVNLYFVDLPGQ